jgi:glycosyltransferase involved in cell wall biosynthesis
MTDSHNLNRKLRLGILTSHPIQYQAPWFRALAQQTDLKVYFAHQPDAVAQGVGFGYAFTWDIDLLSGYEYEFLPNCAKSPDVSSFLGCDTPEIAARIRDSEFDSFIVCGWQLKCFWQAVWACRRCGIPVFVRGDSQLLTPRSILKSVAKEVLYRIMLRQFDGFLCVGERNREYLLHFGISQQKIYPAPHFVDNDWFSEQARQSDGDHLRSEWGCGAGDYVIMFVGKFIPMKRPQDVIEAVAKLPLPDRPLVVFVGSGELESSLKEQCATSSIRAVFAGFRNQSELPACYAAADALVLPSDGRETWGLVVNEAMACGTPAIVSQSCGSCADLVQDDITGYKFAMGDTTALAKCIGRMKTKLDCQYDWRPALREKLNRYSVDSCVAGTLAAVSPR